MGIKAGSLNSLLFNLISMEIPKTKKENVSNIIHGITVSDSYRWLEDTESAETQTWLDKQNEYTRSILDNLPKRKELSQEFEKLFREETIGFPRPRNGYYFFIKRKAEEDLSVLYVKKGLDGEAKILVNPNEISKEKGFIVNLSGYSVSKDASLITYGLSEAANDKASTYVMDVETGKNLPDIIPGDFYPGNGAWTIDNKGFYYTRRKENTPKGEDKFHKKVYYHKLGTDFSTDELVFGSTLAKEDHVGAGVSSDGQYVKVSVTVASEAYRRSEIYLFDLHNKEKGFIPVVKDIKGEEDIEFSSSIHRGFVYIKTNFKTPQCKIQRLAITDIEKGMSAWETIIPESSDKLIEDFDVTNDKLFVLTLENVHSVLREYSLTGEFKREILLPTIGSASSIASESEGDEGFFTFTSFVYPTTIFRIDFKTDVMSVYEKQKIAIDTSDIVSEQVWYESKDKTRIPMFLIHHKDFSLNGENPTVLYGYGGFNISLTPGFNKNIIPFVQRGGLYVIANIRGGGEFGEAWHKAGTKKEKQNVFADFICAGEWLIQNKYTNSSHLAISGGSNGGLLVGAVMTQRPDLVKAIIMAVPVADMLRYHLFHGGRHWIPDYGSADDEEIFPYLLAYSPYHNVKDGINYPATLILTSDQDDRVHPGQAFKMAARLQEANSSNNPILLRVQRKAGHGGAVDISKYIDTSVDQWSFIFWQLGVL
jgi:prolyl oligopeptidase